MSEQSYTERSANAQLEQQREKRILKIFMAVPASILVVLALVFVPMIIADQPRRNFQKNLRKRATPAELQVWGMGVLQFFQTNRNFDYNTITNIHPAFHGLDKWKPNACFFLATPDNPDEYVTVVYGSAAGHWGVEIGPTNRATPTSYSRRYTLWAPGIWFFDGQ